MTDTNHKAFQLSSARNKLFPAKNTHNETCVSRPLLLYIHLETKKAPLKTYKLASTFKKAKQGVDDQASFQAPTRTW